MMRVAKLRYSIFLTLRSPQLRVRLADGQGAHTSAIDAFASMLKSRRMSAAEIIAELPRLSPAELAEVQAKVRELVEPTQADAHANPTAAHPALGIWKDRTDLPADPVEASAVLRDRMMRRTDGAGT
jgi:hypothetical protein